jgi:ribosomal protein S18 acetylase RimI-like enzyme
MSDDEIILLTSEAFPTLQQITSKSEIHKVLKSYNTEININDIIFKPITENMLDELILLHREWFPVKYTNEFFTKIIQNGFTLGAFLQLGDTEYLIGCILTMYRNESYFPLDILPQRSCVDRLIYPFHVAYITTIGVIDECRRLGIGKKLLNRAIDVFTRRTRCVGYYLHVIEHNRSAIQFYRRLRLDEGGMIYDHYLINDALFNAQVFYKQFENIVYVSLYDRFVDLVFCRQKENKKITSWAIANEYLNIV